MAPFQGFTAIRFNADQIFRSYPLSPCCMFPFISHIRFGHAVKLLVTIHRLCAVTKLSVTQPVGSEYRGDHLRNVGFPLGLCWQPCKASPGAMEHSYVTQTKAAAAAAAFIYASRCGLELRTTVLMSEFFLHFDFERTKFCSLSALKTIHFKIKGDV